MFKWLNFYWSKWCAAMVAPIFYHATRDGYVMKVYFMIGEVVDSYGLLILFFFILVTLTFYKNKLFTIFNEKFDLNSNSIKHLILINDFYSRIFLYFIDFFSKKK